VAVLAAQPLIDSSLQVALDAMDLRWTTSERPQMLDVAHSGHLWSRVAMLESHFIQILAPSRMCMASSLRGFLLGYAS
jgi:hypothetical protein